VLEVQVEVVVARRRRKAKRRRSRMSMRRSKEKIHRAYTACGGIVSSPATGGVVLKHNRSWMDGSAGCLGTGYTGSAA
jgi:hypothetical protein